MRRREVIAFMGGAAASLLTRASLAQPAANIPRVILLDPSAPGATSEVYWNAFRAELRRSGYRDGIDLAVETRWANFDLARIPSLLADLSPATGVIVALSTPVALAAKRARSDIPIALSADPVGIGLVASLAKPGSNVTGFSTMSAELGAKRLELLREVIPSLSRVGLLWDETNPAFAFTVKLTEQAAQSLGIPIQVVGIRRAGDAEAAVARLVAARCDALSVTLGAASAVVANAKEVVDIIGSRLPAIYAEREYVRAGGLMSYGPNYPDIFRRVGISVDKILRGAKPADLPVEQPITFDLGLNLPAAKALGIAITPALLARADEVIE